MSFKIFTQHDAMDCGPTCLRMVAAHYGLMFSLETLREKSLISREGVSMLGISEACRAYWFQKYRCKSELSGIDNCTLTLHCALESATLCGGI